MQEQSLDLEMARYRLQLRQSLAVLIERIDSHLQALKQLDPDDAGREESYGPDSKSSDATIHTEPTAPR